MTCFANMPYVMSEFRPSEKGICRVDNIASLAGLQRVEVNGRLEKMPRWTYSFMTPYSGRRVCIESAIQEWCGGAVKVSVCEGGRVEITPVGEVFKNEVENIGRDGVSD